MSNIHSGGALQVANSFVAELLKLESRPFSYKILISNEIASSFEKDELIKSDWSFEVHNTYGLQALWSSLNKIQNEFDSVFTLFGPKYTFFRAKKDIVGFAQAKIMGFFAIDFIMSLLTTSLADNPKKTSAPFIASFNVLNLVSIE